MKNTLEYLLSIAEYDSPELQRSIFEERANVDFAYLRDNRYLVENGRFGNSVFEMGELVHVFRNPYDGKFYYDDCGTLEEVAAERLVLFNVDYTPMARLLGETYRNDGNIQTIIPNSLWNIGVPNGADASVYLARNAGNHAGVRDFIAELPEEDTLLWFGVRPGRRASDAHVVQLQNHLVWRDGGIQHREKWPACITESGGRPSYQNAMILRGDTWDIWFNGRGPVTIESKCSGCIMIARIIEAAGNSLTPLQVSPPKEQPDEPELDHDDREALNGTDGSLPAYDDNEIRQLRKDLAAVRAQLTRAEKDGDKEKAKSLQDTITRFEEHINSNTRPGGKAILAVNPLGNVKRGIRSAITVVCNKLRDNKHNRPDVADHFKDFIGLGDDNRYLDASRNWFIRR